MKMKHQKDENISGKKKIRIVIGDDHQMFSAGLSLLLQSDDKIEVLASAKDGNELIEILYKLPVTPDIVVLDIEMPNLDGVKTATILKKDFPGLYILILSKYDDPSFVKGLIRLGVDGYILKKDTHESLLDAIKIISSDGAQKYFPKEIWGIYQKEEQKKTKSGIENLTKMELIIIKKICCEAKRTNEIAKELFVGENTIEKHRGNIFSKLGIRSVVELVKFAISNGLCEE
jgi:DNA-binding NarL/FixJ family response regulator